MDVSQIRRKVKSRAQLHEDGLSDAEVRMAVKKGRLRRVHHGRYVNGADWDAAFAEERHLMQVVGVHGRLTRSDAVAVLCSAAVIWDLPLFRLVPAKVHLAGPSLNGIVGTRSSRRVGEPPSTRLVARHEMKVADEDVAKRFGIRCTNLERTVFDIARTASLEAAVACADAGLRRVAWSEQSRTYDERAAQE